MVEKDVRQNEHRIGVLQTEKQGQPLENSPVNITDEIDEKKTIESMASA